MNALTYETDRPITTEQFRDVLIRSTLGERRPIDDPECLAGMLEGADLLVTAWSDGRLVGVARSVTDLAYCCYLSDLAVDASLQRRGVGRRLIRETRARLGPRCTLILLSAPAAREYYPRIGFAHHDGAWILRPDDPF